MDATPASKQAADSEGTASAEPKVLDTIVVTGLPRAADTLPGSVTVLEGDALHDGQRQVGLTDALRHVPGFTALDRRNQAQDLQIQSRGFGARSTFGVRGLRLIVDGLPATAADGQSQASAFQMSALDRLYVLRGALALQQGNAAGGAIIGESVLDAAPGIAVDTWYDSDDSHRIGMRLDGGGDEDALRWRVTASHHDYDGFRPHSAARRTQWHAVATWRDVAGSHWKAVFAGSQQPVAADPLGLTRAQYEETPWSTDAAASRFDTRKSVTERQYGLRWRRVLRENDEVVAGVHYVDRHVSQFLALPQSAQAAAGSAGGVIDLQRASTGIDVAYRRREHWGGVALGAEFVRLEEQRRGYENFISRASTPVVLGVRGRLRRDEINRMEAADAWISADYAFGAQWSAMASLRSSWQRIVSRDHYIVGGNGDDSGNADRHNIAAAMGIQRDFAKMTIFANAARGFETPTLTEQAYRADGAAGFNRALRTADMRTYEVGMRWRDGRHHGDLALYRVDGRDEIVPALSSGGRATFANAGNTRRDGVELGLSGSFAEQWSYGLAASWIRARFTEPYLFRVAVNGQETVRTVEAGHRVPGVPQHDLSAELRWQSADSRWRTAIESRMLGPIFVDDRNSDATDSSLRFAWRLQWQAQANMGWHAFLRIDNLLDRAVVGSVIVNEANARYFEPAPGREITLGIGWRGRNDRD